MHIQINKQAIQASFSKAASHYDQFADLQREIGFKLLNKLAENTSPLVSILDLGCGTGYFSMQLQSQFPQAKMTCFDLSPAMLALAAQRQIKSCRFIEGDLDCLPFDSQEFDCVFSNLAVQWSQQLSTALLQLARSLKPQGTLYFSTLLKGSLYELENAWKRVDDQKHINDFLTIEEVRKALELAGLSHYKLHTEVRTKKYKSVLSVMQALKGIGANHVHERSKMQLSGKALLRKLEQGYRPYRDVSGDYVLTYQVCYAVVNNEA